MKKLFYLLMVMAVCIGFSFDSSADQTIIALKASNAPKIDGIADEPDWLKAVPIITHENIGNIEVTLKAVYTDKEIFFLVTFPCEKESRLHRTLTWNKEKKMYVIGSEREDSFVFKWNMDSKPVDLSVYAETPYKSDIWYWKACRTDPAGYADDKYDILSMDKLPDSTKIISKKGNTLYYGRYGDEGNAAYSAAEPPLEYKGDKIPMFNVGKPTGSRADVAAKGQWKAGKWTIEFKRLLFTGSPDDVQFDTKGTSYQFGIALYEIAGQKPDPKERYYGAGDVAESLFLKFAE
jgi:hypothetical protein